MLVEKELRKVAWEVLMHVGVEHMKEAKVYEILTTLLDTCSWIPMPRQTTPN